MSDKVTLEECKAFIVSADKSRSDWLEISKRSWNEIKRRAPDGNLRSFDINRKKGKYPLWYNIKKIRESIVYSRLGIPIAKDTSETGNDSIGASAAFFKERLAVNLAKDDDPRDTMFACRDDLLATDFTIAVGYYEKEDVKEKVKEYLTSQQDPRTQEISWYDQAGKLYKDDDFEQDDDGIFTYLPRTIDVTNESVCVEHVLYKDVYIDPDIKRWKRCRRLAFKYYYSVPEFKDLFGSNAFDDLALAERNKGNSDFEKTQNIETYQYWDYYTKETKWFHQSSEKFLEPQTQYAPDEDYDGDDIDTGNGILNLPQFWPCVKPRIRNASTDGFWPTPEYYQFVDILFDIDNIFTRIIQITKIIRPKLFYDDDIDGIAEGIGIVSDTEVIGVPNLTKVLSGAGGNLNNVAQFLDITTQVNALETLTNQLEQRIGTVKQLAGVNDMLQGLSNDNSGKTLGERQMEQKYSLSLIEEMQVMMAELDRDTHELRCDIALNNFKDESLVKYMIPETAPENHQRNFRAALTLLKDNNKRFRLDIETDSTIAINEQYNKQMRAELQNAMTQTLSGVVDLVESHPQMAKLSLETFKYYIQSFRGSKIFQEEISHSIDEVIKDLEAQAEAAKNAPPQFDKDQAEHEFDMAKLGQDGQIAQEKIQSEQLIKSAEMAQAERLAGLEAQIEQMKLEAAAGKTAADNQTKLQEIQATFEIAIQDIQVKRDQLTVNAQAITDENQRLQFEAMVDAQYKSSLAAIEQARQRLEETYLPMDLAERVATEKRLQNEHEWITAKDQLEMVGKVHGMHLDVAEHKHEKVVEHTELALKNKEIGVKEKQVSKKAKEGKKK